MAVAAACMAAVVVAATDNRLSVRFDCYYYKSNWRQAIMGIKDNSRKFLGSAVVRSAPAALWQTASDRAESFIGPPLAGEVK
jgi:hypothetical protein